MRYPHARILVFCKPPIPGHAKTRLIPALGAEGAAALHANLARGTVAQVIESELAPLDLWVSGDPEHDFFRRLRADYEFRTLRQCGADLGARMAHAMEATLAEAEFAVLVGTDCPALTADDLAQACAALADGADAVLGPAEDGGYVLIGLRQCDQMLFSDIAWGTPAVLRQTRDRLSLLGWSVHELPMRWDLDRPEDLARL